MVSHIFLQMSLNAPVNCSCSAVFNKLNPSELLQPFEQQYFLCTSSHSRLCMHGSQCVCVTENSFDCHLSPQRPAGHPEDGVRLGDGPGAAQRPRPPRRKGSQGWLRYQSSPACGGTLEHTGLSSTALLTNPFSSAPLTSLSFYPTPPRSCTAWPKLLRVNVNQAYEAHAAPAVLCVMSKLNPSWMRR